MKVKLYTKDGALVHEQTIQPFTEPDVIIWGDRIFSVPSVDGEVARRFVRDDDADIAYEEAFTVRLGAPSARAPLLELVRDASRLLSPAGQRRLGWGGDVRDWQRAAGPFVGK